MGKKNRTHLYFIAVILAVSGGIWAFSLGEAPLDFNTDIRPILNAKCLACHGGVKKQGGFSLLFREEALGVTESGKPAILPGDPDHSEFILRLTHPDPEMRMPYEAEPLTREEIRLLKRWVKEGAKWENPWSFQPPDPAISPPRVKSSWVRNDIDRFVLKRIKDAGLKPSGEADKATLFRRLSLDLTGLPADPVALQDFLEDKSSTAYEKAVERLLASPAFGERWASHWLDLARYADSKGYEKDLNRSIWMYRDWVVDAFNRDLPFNQFTIEQLAGDLLPEPTQQQLIATAFHRNTMANDEGGTNDEEFRVAAVVERVGTTYEVWQGLTMSCVQCHSHPYDPIRHEAFYQSLALFNNTSDRDLYNEQPRVQVYPDTSRKKVADLMEWIKQKAALSLPDTFLHQQKEDLLSRLGYRHIQAEEYQAASRFIELTAPDQRSVYQIQDSSWIMYESLDLTEVQALRLKWSSTNSGGFVELRLDSLEGKRIGRSLLGKTGNWKSWEWKKIPISAVSGSHNLYLCFYRNQDRVQELVRLDEIELVEARPLYQNMGAEVEEKLKILWETEPISTPIFQELKGEKRRKTHVFQRGNWLSPGKEVQPGVPAALSSEEISDRLEFARWLVSPENPLTARVTVNRFWEQVFGRGLVETVEDFGSQGATPSHPELLDWLALRFQNEMGWRVKALLKEIVMSATYRQSSAVTQDHLRRDPDNRLLARMPRLRLSAEQVRDQMLVVSGLLDSTQGGPPVRFEDLDPLDAYKQGQFFAYNPYRRALYAYWRRSNPLAVMTTFDSPNRSACTSRRVRTNTPLQALILLNDNIAFEAAKALGLQMYEKAGAGVGEALEWGYVRAMGSLPEAEKLSLLRQMYEDGRRHYGSHPEELCLLFEEDVKVDPSPELGGWVMAAHVILNLDEFVVRD